MHPLYYQLPGLSRAHSRGNIAFPVSQTKKKKRLFPMHCFQQPAVEELGRDCERTVLLFKVDGQIHYFHANMQTDSGKIVLFFSFFSSFKEQTQEASE